MFSVWFKPVRRASRPRVRRGAWITLAVLALLLANLPHVTPAYAHVLEQVQLGRGGGDDAGRGIAVDSAGNRYLTGSFQGRVTFGSGSTTIALNSFGSDDAFVVKYDAAGTIVWARQIGAGSSDQGRGIAVASDGSVVVTGIFNVQASFGGGAVRLASRGASDGFVARYTADGQLLWAFRLGGTTGDNGLGIAADQSGNAVITGSFADEASFADADNPAAATLRSAGGIDSFVAKYNLEGQLLWARGAGGSGNDSGRGIVTDRTGDVYLAGGFSADATFAAPGRTLTLTSAGLDDVYVARYSAGGALLWAQRAGGAKADRALAIALDATGNSYLTGFFTENATFGATALTGVGADIFLAKVSPDGVVQQAVSAGGAGADEGRGVAVAPNGTVYVTGRFVTSALFGAGANMRELRTRDRVSASSTGVFTAAYTGSFQPSFVESAGGESRAQEHGGNAVASDAANRAHVTGSVHDVAFFGSGSTTFAERLSGLGDVFLVSYATGTPREVFYFSSTSGGTIDGIGFADEDVLAYDPANNRWSVLLDGSDIGLANTDVDGFEWRPDRTLLLSFDTPITLPGIAFEVDDSDVVRFVPTQLGATTSGRFEFFFDGSDVGLDSDNEDVDAIAIRADGKLVISTLGAATVPSVGGTVTAAQVDLLLFSGDRLGEATRGTWQRVFEGGKSQLGDQANEGLAALWFLPNDDFVIGTGGPFVLSALLELPFGDGAEGFRCGPFNTGDGVRCGFDPFVEGPAIGLRGEIVDALSVGESGVLGDIGDGDDTEPGPPEDPIAVPDPGTTLFVPLVNR